MADKRSMDEVQGDWGRRNSLQCLQFAKMESKIDTQLPEGISDETAGVLLSPCRSDSSGVSSLWSAYFSDSTGGSDVAFHSDFASHKDTSSSPEKPPVVMYQGRDILDVGANLRDPRWNLQYAMLPENDVGFFMENRSQYNRINNFGPFGDQPLPVCEICRLMHGVYNSCTFYH